MSAFVSTPLSDIRYIDKSFSTKLFLVRKQVLLSSPHSKSHAYLPMTMQSSPPNDLSSSSPSSDVTRRQLLQGFLLTASSSSLALLLGSDLVHPLSGLAAPSPSEAVYAATYNEKYDGALSARDDLEGLRSTLENAALDVAQYESFRRSLRSPPIANMRRDCTYLYLVFQDKQERKVAEAAYRTLMRSLEELDSLTLKAERAKQGDLSLNKQSIDNLDHVVKNFDRFFDIIPPRM